MGNQSSNSQLHDRDNDCSEDDVNFIHSSKEERLVRKEELSQIAKFLKWRKDACFEKEREISLREEELEKKECARAKASTAEIELENLKAWVEKEEEKRKRERQEEEAAHVERKRRREEEEQWRREV